MAKKRHLEAQVLPLIKGVEKKEIQKNVFEYYPKNVQRW